MVADEYRLACTVLGQLRLELGGRPVSEGPYRYLWVVDFPMFDGVDDAGQPGGRPPSRSPCPTPTTSTAWSPTRPRCGPGLRPGPQRLGAGSGSVRIHRADIQSRVFAVLGIGEEEAQSRFGFLLGAFRYGAPPHAGFAVGIDRLVAIFAGEDSIREVIAFPKTQSGSDPMTGAPKPAGPGVLADLGLQPVPPQGLSGRRGRRRPVLRRGGRAASGRPGARWPPGCGRGPSTTSSASSTWSARAPRCGP